MSTSPLEQALEEQLESLREQQAYRQLSPCILGKGLITLLGHDAEQTAVDLVNFNSNDYLGLSACSGAVPKPSVGSTSSRLLVGDTVLAHQLEMQLAEALQHQTALLFNSGYHANLGILPAIAQPGMVVLADKLIHASMIDGLLLSKLPFSRFKHNSLPHLERLLAAQLPKARHIVIMVESVYSMDGDLAPLRELVALKRRYPQIILYVDEAHAVGVRGETGMGYAQELGLLPEIDLLVGTFGKAYAGIGAYVACKHVVRETLINKCRPLIYSTMLPSSILSANQSHFVQAQEMCIERAHLAQMSLQLRTALFEMNLHTPSESHIIPILCGCPQKAKSLASFLQNQGFYTRPICAPTVPAGSERIRLSLCANHTNEQIDLLIQALRSFFS